MLVDIKKIKRVCNKWPKLEHYKVLGRHANESIRRGLHAVSIRVLTVGVGIGSMNVELLLEDVRKNLNDSGIHCCVLMYVFRDLNDYKMLANNQHICNLRVQA